MEKVLRPDFWCDASNLVQPPTLEVQIEDGGHIRVVGFTLYAYTNNTHWRLCPRTTSLSGTKYIGNSKDTDATHKNQSYREAHKLCSAVEEHWEPLFNEALNDPDPVRREYIMPITKWRNLKK